MSHTYDQDKNVNSFKYRGLVVSYVWSRQEREQLQIPWFSCLIRMIKTSVNRFKYRGLVHIRMIKTRTWTASNTMNISAGTSLSERENRELSHHGGDQMLYYYRFTVSGSHIRCVYTFCSWIVTLFTSIFHKVYPEKDLKPCKCFVKFIHV